MKHTLLIKTCLVLITSVCFYPLSNASGSVEVKEVEPEKGPHRGRMLRDDDFALELSIFETGVPPEFRVWPTINDQPISPSDVDLKITLTRLGNVKDVHQFKPQGDFLRGDSVVYEPHSFVVTATASYQGKQYEWQYDNFEGRTTIEPEVGEALDIRTETAGSATIKETIKVFGQLKPLPEGQRKIQARFQGLITDVFVTLGQTVKKGDRLLTIESNESLKTYDVRASIDGTVVSINAQPMEQTRERVLMVIENTNKLNAELSVFPSDREKLKMGAKLKLSLPNNDKSYSARVTQIDNRVQSNQALTVRALIDNAEQELNAGSFVTAYITVDEHPVELAVKRVGLQAFRDFTVVYAKVGNEYEVRMLELGRSDAEWIEVLGGLKPGTEYVTENSYILKADIEKSGASHDH